MKLSVVIPTYNRCDLLCESASSVLRQPFPVHELIIVDDGSGDGTVAACKEIQRRATPATVVVSRSAENLGAQVARNRGFSLVTGEAVMFLDSDDALTNDGLTPLMRALEEDKQLDFVYGKVVKTAADLTPLAGVRPVGMPFGPDSAEIAGWHWAIMGAVYRTDYLKRVGPWNEDLSGSQDWEFQGRVKLAGGRWHFADHVVAFWRLHEGPHVGTSWFRPDYVRSVEKACLSLRDHARAVGRLKVGLRRRLARKLYLHALEFSINDYPDDRRRLIREAIELIDGVGADQCFLRLARFMPKSLDIAVWYALRAAAECRSVLLQR